MRRGQSQLEYHGMSTVSGTMDRNRDGVIERETGDIACGTPKGTKGEAELWRPAHYQERWGKFMTRSTNQGGFGNKGGATGRGGGLNAAASGISASHLRGR